MSERKIIEEIAAQQMRLHPHEVEWWETTYDPSGKNLLKFSISPLKFAELVRALDFVRLDIDAASIFIRVTSGTVCEEVQVKTIRDEVWDVVNKLDDPVDGNQLSRDRVLAKILTSLKTLFDVARLEMIRPIKPIKFLSDTKGERYMLYRNTVARVTGMGVEQVRYVDLEAGHIWKSQIIPRDFVPGADWRQAVFYQFMQKVCGDDASRVSDLMRITGYLLHGYDGGKLKAINFTDSQVASGRESNGRSGKSLYALALAHALTPENPRTSKVVANLNGKDFKPGDERKYQSCGPETRIIVINDLKDNFPVKMLYNDITEGQVVDRKYQQPFRITAKMLFIGNEALRVEGESSIDRILEFEFANFFSSRRSPQDYFGHWFFTDWKADEWARFDALMVHCVQLWLADPVLPQPKAVTLNVRKQSEHTSPEFCEFMEHLAPARTDHYDRDADWSRRYNKKELYLEFTQTYTDFDPKRFSMRRFTAWLRTWTKYSQDYDEFDERRDQYRSDRDFFIFFRTKRKAQ